MINIGDSTALYFYSAVFQGNMALVALTGVFVIYRLSVLSGMKRYISASIVGIVERDLGEWIKQGTVPALYTAIESIKEELEKLGAEGKKWSEKAKDLLSDRTFTALVKEYDELTEHENQIKRRMLLPLALTLAVVIVSLILLPLARVVHDGCACAELMMLAGTVVLNILALATSAWFIVVALRVK